MSYLYFIVDPKPLSSTFCCYLLIIMIECRHPMKTLEKTRFDLDKRFQKVLKTPASFAFFMAIHDFIEYIELNSALSNGLSYRIKTNRDLGLQTKYGYLKQIYQGIEDTNVQSADDLGHERYVTIRDLNRIKNKETFEHNSFWRKRELFRKSTVEIYERLNLHLSKSEK